MKKFIWAIPALLVASGIAAQELGSGDYFGLLEGGGGGAAFTGDLATDNALQDSSDNVIDIAASQNMCWASSTCIDGSAVDGTLEITNNAVGNSAGRICLGPDGLAANPCLENAGFNAALRDGTGAMEFLEANGLFGYDTFGGTSLLEVYSDQIHLEEGHAGGGYIGWNNASGAAGDDVVLFAIENNSTERFVACTDSPAGLTSFVHNCSFKMGDNSAGANHQVCDLGLAGVIIHGHIAGDEHEELMVCQSQNSGSTPTETFRWASLDNPTSHWYVEDNSVVTEITGPGTWDAICGKTTTACDTDIFNVGHESGFYLATGDTFEVSGVRSHQTSVERFFHVSYNISFSGSGGATRVYRFTVTTDDNEAPTFTQENCYSRRTISTTDVGSLSGSCVISLDVDGTNNDSFYLSVEQLSGATADITVVEANLVVRAM